MAVHIPREVGAEGALAGAQLLSRPAEEFVNDPSLETAWAFKAIEHMEVYFNLLCAVDPKLLKLTPHDDKIYEDFRNEFPDFTVDILNEEALKSEQAKEKWRPFCEKFEGIVEDFNFGTMIRINSSDEYSEANSIFVPRIQFYAIEIARNREGYNDDIRKKFKHIPKHKKAERQNTTESDCLLSSFTCDLQEYFDQFCRTHTLPKIVIKKFIKREDGSLRKGDFSIFFGKPTTQNLCSHCKKLSLELPAASQKWGLPISNCMLLPTTHFQINLAHSAVFRKVLQTISRRKHKYGRHSLQNSKSILIIAFISQKVESQRGDELSNLRIVIAAKHISALFEAIGYHVYLSCDAPQPCLSESLSNIFHSAKNGVNIIKCQESCDHMQVRKIWEDKAHNLPTRVLNSEVVNKRHGVCHQEDFIILNGKQFLEDHNIAIGSRGYDKNVGYIYAKTEQWTDCFNTAVFLQHILQSHLPKAPVLIVNIVPHFKSFFCQQMGILWSMMSPEIIKQQAYLVLQPVSAINTCNEAEVTVETYFSQRECEVKKALIHKYGETVLSDHRWTTCMQSLVDTWIKFDLLMTSCSLPVKLNLLNYTEDKKTLDFKGGLFVQYNCARLEMIFNNHQQKIDSGVYPSLPSVDEVDFTQLKLEEEWRLLFNYILPFPNLLQEVIQVFQQPNLELRPQVHTYKICQMLLNLSNDLSAYYSRVHILVEPRPHLMPCLSARLWLLKGLHQVMKNSLNLLGISPLIMM